MKLNVLTLVFLVFISKFEGTKDVPLLLDTYFPKRNIEIDRKRETPYEEEIS